MTLLEEEENKARRSSKSGQTSTKPPMGGANDRHPQHSQEEVAESGPSEGSSGKRRTRKAKASRKAMSEGTETEDVAENIEMEPVDSKDKVMTEDSVQEIEELTEDLLWFKNLDIFFPRLLWDMSSIIKWYYSYSGVFKNYKRQYNILKAAFKIITQKGRFVDTGLRKLIVFGEMGRSIQKFR